MAEQHAEGVPRPRTITRLVVQKHDKTRASVYLDGSFAFGVHQELVLKYGLRKGRVLTVEEQQAIERADRLMKAKAAGLHYVAHKARSEGEVRRKLREKDYDDAIVTQVVERLRELEYLDDAAYARDYVRGRFAHRGYGPVRLRQELRRREVDAALIEDALAEQLDEEALLQAARDHARKKWDLLDPGEDPRRRRQKLFAYLQRRGFTYDTIRRVVDEVAEAP